MLSEGQNKPKLPDPILGRAVGFAVSALLAVAILGLFAALHALQTRLAAGH